MSRPDSVWPGLLLAVFGAWQTYEAASISTRSLVPNDPVTSATLPTALGVLTFVTGVALFVRRWLRSRAEVTGVVAEEPATSPVNRRGVLRVFGAVVASIVYAFLLLELGYVIATPLFLATLITIATTRRLRPIATALVAVLVATGCYLLFVVLLQADIPAMPT